MTVFNLLTALAVSGVTRPSGMWEFLLGLFDFIKNYGVRVIVFTVLLKLLLLPLDFYQKHKMKKNERITKALKPEMDRLQKTYANNKQALQQEQMKLQRASGFSYFSTCLPMIITLLIFFSFFAGMRSISQYEEFKQYVELYDVYSVRYTDLTGLNMTGDGGLVEDYNHDEFQQMILDLEDGEITPAQEAALLKISSYMSQSDDWFEAAYKDYEYKQKFVAFFSNPDLLKPSGDYVYTESALFYNGIISGSNARFDINAISDYTGDKTTDLTRAKQEIIAKLNAELSKKDYGIGRTVEGGTLYNTNSVIGFPEVVSDYTQIASYADLKQTIDVFLNLAHDSAADAVYNYYTDNKQGFLWIKSLWVADAPWKDAVPDFATFKSNVSKYFSSNAGHLDSQVLNDLNSKDTYNRVMLRIRNDKDLYATNGYLVLAILSVALSFLSQFVTRRQQKNSGQVATGTSGSTMKMMMLIMPAMSAVFAVMYTAAFALYMITSSAMTLLINVLTTTILGGIYKSKHKEEVSDDGVVRYGRRDPNDYINKGGKK